MNKFNETYNNFRNTSNSSQLKDPIEVWSSITSKLEKSDSWNNPNKSNFNEALQLMITEIESSGLSSFQKDFYKNDIKNLIDWVQIGLYLEQQLRGY